MRAKEHTQAIREARAPDATIRELPGFSHNATAAEIEAGHRIGRQNRETLGCPSRSPMTVDEIQAECKRRQDRITAEGAKLSDGGMGGRPVPWLL